MEGKECPRGLKTRRPAGCRLHDGGFSCACLIPRSKVPKHCAPEDRIMVCHFVEGENEVDHIDRADYCTPDEALSDAWVRIKAVEKWFYATEMTEAMRDEMLNQKIFNEVLGKGDNG